MTVVAAPIFSPATTLTQPAADSLRLTTMPIVITTTLATIAQAAE
jgi:hypothetical protein